MIVIRICLLVAIAASIVFATDEVRDSADGDLRDTSYETSWSWEPYQYSDSLYADLNCDGVADLAYGTIQDSTFTVHVVIGPFTDSSKTSELPVCLGKGSFQDCLCGMEVIFQVESLYADSSSMLTDLEFVPDGYEPSKTCRGLNVAAGECDTFHCFWDHNANELSWWRL